jgi:SPP1 family predicted phage head-tail adaptor
MIAAGKLRERVTIKHKVVTGKDAKGADLFTWEVLVDNLPAEVEPLTGREFFAADQAQSSVDLRVRVRFREDITNAMQLVWNGQPHDIDSVLRPKANRAFLELMCMSGVHDGR